MKKKAIVFGGGLSGIGAKKLLEKKEYEVFLVDDKTAISTKEGIKILDNENIEFIVKSPGISWEVDFLKYAKEKNKSIISEIDLAYEYMDKNIKIIGITGTNGKTTTVTKIYEILKMANKKVVLAGNSGYSFAEMVSEEKEVDFVVLELSSYQLENNPRVHCYISGIINLTPDHLSRYESIEDYYLTKFNIFENQDENDYALINSDDKEVIKIFDENKIKSKKIYLSKKSNIIEKYVNINEVALKGEHNLENLMFIVTVAEILGISDDIIIDFLKNTKPLEHRLENFYNYKNTTFINDSKGTNIESTIKAIDSYENKVVLILGGDNKGVSNIELVKKIREKVSFVYLIGENADILIDELEKQNYKNYKNLFTLENVVQYMYENENFSENKTVLLSPATSSWCQFKNFEHRGNTFKELVKTIIK